MSDFVEGENSIANDVSTIMKGDEADKAADFANYFCSYGFLYHQKQMVCLELADPPLSPVTSHNSLSLSSLVNGSCSYESLSLCHSFE